ncbi:hypothetical protein MCOR02_011960 [Pyricularia oryzae]|nr:hypothetical protein MCOR02_011960 [Pyricularia oryzae]KAI6291612.1 hypothetical protein MCOR34_010152 [Pyricularia oryzae]KAI6487680.1 hypothetical protein MCOR13_009184 [Pyricularia oryzae]
MLKVAREFFGESVDPFTILLENAGVADGITSCISGRNFRCANMAVKRGLSVEIEEKELNGQQLQGTFTAKESNSLLNARGGQGDYPLFTTFALPMSTCVVNPTISENELGGSRQSSGLFGQR